MANKLIELLISAKDTTKGAFDSTINRLTLLKKKATALRSIGSVVGSLFAGYGALQSFKAVIAATREQEAVLRQVEQRLISTGGASGETLASLQKMAAGLQDVTTYGDESILKMQSLLLTFTNIKGDTFQAATESILDMSIAMGQDLKTSALQLGKALNDPIAGINALTRVGVKFTDQQKEQIRTLTESGQVAQAQAIILKELQVEFGGAATAAADTFGGAIEQLGNAWGDLLEAKGGLNDGKEAIKELTAVLQDPNTKQAFDQLSGAAIRFGTALSEAAVKGINLFIEAGEKLGETLAEGSLKLQGMSTEMASYVRKQDEMTASTEESKVEIESLADTVERLGKEADASRDLLEELGGVEYGNTDFSEGVGKVLDKLEEERKLLKLSAKEQFIYNQVKKAGTDATYEEINAIRKSAESLFEEKQAAKAAASEIRGYSKAKQDDLEKDVGKRLGKDADLETIDLVRKLQDARRQEGQYGDPAQALRDAKEAIRVAAVLRENNKASQHFLDSMVKQAAEIARNAAGAEKDTIQQTVNQQIKQTIDVGEVTNEITTKLVDIQTILDKNPLKIKFIADVNTQNIAKQALKEGTKQ